MCIMCKTVSIRAGEWSAEIYPGFGMNAISLKVAEREILRKPETYEALKNSPYLHGIPLLFPANRTKGGAFVFDGKKYELPLNEPERNNHIHGQMFDAPFTVTKRTESCIEAEYENRKERYPFPFLMKIRDEVNENGFFRTLSVLNTGKTPFPYTLAFHTTFKEPEILAVPIEKRFLCNENYIPTGRYALLTCEEREYVTGIKIKDKSMSGFYVSSGREARLDDIRFSVSDNFDEWILYNGDGKNGFVCVEPQAGEVNGLNRDGGARILMPDETHTYTLSITRKEEKGEEAK